MSSVATVLACDPDTFHNQLDQDGTVLVDVPVFDGLEARTFRPGDRLLLVELDGGEPAIAGRVIIPEVPHER